VVGLPPPSSGQALPNSILSRLDLLEKSVLSLISSAGTSVTTTGTTSTADATFSSLTATMATVTTANLTNLNIGTVKITVDSSGALKVDGNLVVGKVTTATLATSELTVAGNLSLNEAIRGIKVPAVLGSSSYQISFTKAQPDDNYAVSVTPTWNTTIWVSNRTIAGFTVNFVTPAPEGGTIDWMIVR
jgi:hypothetical protein